MVRGDWVRKCARGNAPMALEDMVLDAPANNIELKLSLRLRPVSCYISNRYTINKAYKPNI